MSREERRAAARRARRLPGYARCGYCSWRSPLLVDVAAATRALAVHRAAEHPALPPVPPRPLVPLVRRKVGELNAEVGADDPDAPASGSIEGRLT